jgi:cytochrome oxidase Cu insertion factor (SCO1/SenC/PrrC family)
VQTGTDWRYLWVAISAFVGSSIVIAVGKSQSRTSSVTVAIAALALIAATLTAVLGAKFLTNTQSVATWIVAFAFAFCTTVGTVLYFVSKPRTN